MGGSCDWGRRALAWGMMVREEKEEQEPARGWQGRKTAEGGQLRGTSAVVLETARTARIGGCAMRRRRRRKRREDEQRQQTSGSRGRQASRWSRGGESRPPSSGSRRTTRTTVDDHHCCSSTTGAHARPHHSFGLLKNHLQSQQGKTVPGPHRTTSSSTTKGTVQGPPLNPCATHPLRRRRLRTR